jgi:hypothetical protein
MLLHQQVLTFIKDRDMKILKKIIMVFLILNYATAFSTEKKANILSFTASDFKECQSVILTVDQITPAFESALNLATSGPVQANSSEMIFLEEYKADSFIRIIFRVGPAVNEANIAPFLIAMDKIATLPGFKWGCLQN